MKVCVVGAGRWGKNHINTLAKMGVLESIIEPLAINRDSVSSSHPNIKTYKSLSEKGAMSAEAYIVAVPAEQHYDIAETLLRNQKHVLVEKPITLNISDAKSLVSLANSEQLILQTGHLLLFHPAFQKMKELINSGKIGKIQYLYSNRLNLGTVRTEENSLWSFAPHDIALFHFLVGSKPERVESSGGAFLQSHIHDTSMTVCHYPGNVVGHIFVSWLHPFKEHRFVVIGSKGMLSYEDSSKNKDLLFYEKGIDWINGEPVKRDGPTEVIPYEKSQPLENELNHFIECIRNQTLKSPIDGNAGVDVLSVLEEADHSLKKTSPLSTKQNETRNNTPYFIHEKAIIDPSARVGKNSKIWQYSNIQKNVDIGSNCILGQNVNIGNNVKIGKNVKIQNNVSVYEGVELEDYVFCGPSMVFTNIRVPRSKYPQAESKYYVKTLVKEGASIGANATIVCGITIGHHAFIGAGAVVTKDVPDHAIVIGNPGKVIGWMSEGGTVLDFSEEKQQYCEKSQKVYEIKNGKLVVSNHHKKQKV